MMNPMMNGVGSMYLFLGLQTLHGLGVLLFSIAILFLLTWAYKSWSAKEFKTTGMWLLILGILLCILSLAGGRPMGWKYGREGMMREKMLMEMMEELDAKDATATASERKMHGEMKKMMEGMMDDDDMMGSGSSRAR